MHEEPEQGDYDRPKVSVVIPTCNRREVLARCLHALTQQTYSDYEIIVVDDCSSDGTPQLLEEFGAQHSNAALPMASQRASYRCQPQS